MAKIVECAKVDPSSGCKHVVRAQTDEQVLKKAAEHAKQHGIRDVTPEFSGQGQGQHPRRVATNLVLTPV